MKMPVNPSLFAARGNPGSMLDCAMKLAITGLLFICPIVNVTAADQPLTIQSDSFHFDNQTGIATYTGNVIATQTDRHLTGDRLEIFRDNDTGKMTRIIVHGNPAYYEGINKPGEAPIHAQAELITYDIATEFLTLTKNAIVEQEGNEYRSDKIEYDGIKETVYSPPSTKGRTTIILKDAKDAGI